MTRPLITIAALVLVGAAFGQGRYSQKDRLGKSVDEVVAMGQKRWSDFYYGKVPFSGVTRGVADAIYRDSLAVKNARSARGLSASRKRKIDQTKRTLTTMYHGLAHVQYAFQGGNAWDPDSEPAEIQELTQRLIVWPNVDRKYRPSNGGTVSVLRRQIEGFFRGAPARIRTKAANGGLRIAFPRRGETPSQARSRVTREVLGDLAKSRSAYRSLQPLLSTYNPREAAEILRLVRKWCTF